jgi:hypothetical protein
MLINFQRVRCSNGPGRALPLQPVNQRLVACGKPARCARALRLVEFAARQWHQGRRLARLEDRQRHAAARGAGLIATAASLDAISTLSPMPQGPPRTCLRATCAAHVYVWPIVSDEISRAYAYVGQHSLELGQAGLLARV